MMIRPARSEDFTAIAAITNHYVATTAIHFAYEPLVPDELRDSWAAHPRHPWFVAEEAGAVAGYAKAGPWRERAAYAWTCEVGLYIAAASRGRRLGTGLYAVLLDELARAGFRSAVAGITLPNPASVALHENLGFTRVGTFADAGYKQAAWHAVEFWQKRFATGEAAPPAW